MEPITSGHLNELTSLLAEAMKSQAGAYQRFFEQERYKQVKLSPSDLLARHPWMMQQRNEIIDQKGLSAWAEYQQRIDKIARKQGL